MESMVCYEISMICYEISMLCYAMVYVVKDKHSATVICVYDAIYWNGMFIDNYIFYNMDSSYDDSLLLYDGSASVFHWDALIK